jgi:[acyl-carrier-protein] S-malonyltransferase
MGKDLWESSQGVRELFTLASQATGMDTARLLFEGSEEELRSTDKTQIAVTLMNLAAGRALAERGLEPDGVAGFSLGEYSALHEAGVIRLEDLFPVVKARGELMEAASRRLDSTAGPAGMAAVLGLTLEEAEKVLGGLQGEEVYPANYSSPRQIVLSGTAEGLARAEARFKEAGARRVVRLKVSAPFHSPLLEEARVKFAEILSRVPFSDPVKPLYANVTGERVTAGGQARELCLRQVISPVRWVRLEESLLADGFQRFIESGPGTVLTGLWKAFNEKYPCYPAGKLENHGDIFKG